MAAGAQFGTAFVDIQPDLDAFTKALNKKLEVALGPLDAKFKAVGDSAGKSLSKGVDKHLESTGAKARATTKDVDGLGGGLNKLNVALGNSTHETKLFSNAMKLVKPAALITGVGFLAEGLSAAAAGGIALGSALGPVVGLGAALPAIGIAGAQAMGTWKLATLGVSGAFEDLGKKLKEPSAAAKGLADKIKPLVGRVVELRDVAQKPIFAALTASLPKVSGLFPILRRGIGQTAQAIGGLINRAAALVSSKGFGADLDTQMGRNAVTISRLGRAGLNLGDAFRHIVIAAGPLVSWLTKAALRASEGFLAFAKQGRESGRMAGFFEKTRAVTERLVSIAGSLATALFNIGKAGAPLGNELLKSIDANATRFAEWTASASGQNKIALFFENARGPIYEVGNLIRDATKAFFRMGQGANVGPLIRQFRTELLPVIESVVTSTTKAFGPDLIRTLTELAKLFGSMAGSSGPLVLFVRLVGLGARALNSLIGNNPALQSSLVTFAGLAAVIKTIQFAGMVTGISTVRNALMGLRTAYIAQTGASTASTLAAVRWKVATIGTTVATAASTVATKAMAAAQLLWTGITKAATVAAIAFNVVLRANPIVLLVTALALLVAGLVLAYQKSETFRDIVNAVWAAIKTVVGTTIGWLTTAIPAAWEWIKNATIVVWDAIKGYLTLWWTVVSGVVTTYVGVVQAVITAAWNAIKTVTTTVWDAIKTYLTLWWTVVSGGITAYVGAVRDVVLTAWRAIRDTGKLIWDQIKAALSLAWSGIKLAADLAWDIIRLAILTPIRGARDTLALIWTAVRTVASGAWSALSGVASGAWDAVRLAILTPIRAARDILGEIWGQVKETAGNAWDKITDGAKTFAGNFKDVIVNAFKAAANKVVDFVNKIISVINKIPGVNIGKVAGFAAGGVVGTQALAQGGKVTRPIVMMGEEAPRHPEYVIPTNPAYRGRAQDLLAQAASKIGMASGGVLSRDQIEAVYKGVGGSGNAKLMAAIALAESSGRIGAIGNDPGGTTGLGLWQITTGFNDDVIARFGGRNAMLSNPAANAKAADAIFDRQGLGAWVVYGSGAYKQFMDGGGGGGGIGSIIPNIPSLGDLVGKLPGLGDLPGWLKGTGKYVLDKVTGWIKDKLASLVPKVPGSGGLDEFLGGTWMKANALAKKFGLTITDGWRPQNAGYGAPNSSHKKGTPENPGAHDFVPPSAAAKAYAYNPLGAMWADIHDYGSGLHLHVSWFREGGVIGQAIANSVRSGLSTPSMHNGGWVSPPGGRKEMTANLLRGEYVLDPNTAAAVARDGGSRPIYADIYIGGEKIDERVEVKIRENDRQGAHVYRAGISR